jgi:hypothetical protein
MPNQVTLLNVFISSPQELAAERRIVESIISELNPKLLDSYRVQLRAITWATYVVPGVGSDPQAVINNQIGDNYDIYIGILGERFGSRTPRAGSGTEEEFIRAYDRFQTDEGNVRILFYFKNSSDIPLQNLDLAQLARVQDFRKQIGSKGTLYSDFKTTDEFLVQVREHLWGLIAHQWNNGTWATSGDSNALKDATKDGTLSAPVVLARMYEELSKADKPQLEEEAQGILDIMAESEESIQAATQALERITALTLKVNDDMVHHATRITALSSGETSPKVLRAAVDGAADDMDSYARSLRAEIPAFVSGFTSAVDVIDGIVLASLSRQSPNRDESIATLRRSLASSIASIKSGREPVKRLRDVVAEIPGLTKRTKRATGSVKTQLDELIAGITVISDRAESVLARLRDGGDSVSAERG